MNYLQEGGPIGLIENEDIINVDVENKRIDVQLTDQEMEKRRKNWIPPAYKANRGILYKVCVRILICNHLFLVTIDCCILRITLSCFAVHQECAVGFKGLRD